MHFSPNINPVLCTANNIQYSDCHAHIEFYQTPQPVVSPYFLLFIFVFEKMHLLIILVLIISALKCFKSRLAAVAATSARQRNKSKKKSTNSVKKSFDNSVKYAKL